MLRMMTPIAVVACALTVAFAQDTVYDNLDKNGDGVLTQDEFEQNVGLFNRLLTLYDKDQDGKITKAEYLKLIERADKDTPAGKKAGEAERSDGSGLDPESVFARLDNNQNGQIEFKELPPLFQQKFAPIYQSKKTDALTKEDFISAYNLVFPRQREESKLLSPEVFFKSFDKNQDSKVTLDEIPKEFQPTFKQLFDRHNIEFITKDDYTQLFELLAQRSRRDETETVPNPGGDVQGTFSSNEQDAPGFTRRPAGGDFPPRGPNFFGLLDTDRDGKLSTSELSQASQLVARLDRDQDGLLDPSEVFGYGRGRPESGRRFGPGRGRPDLAERTNERPERPQRPSLNEEPKATAGTVRPENPQPRRTPANIHNASNTELVDDLFRRFDGNQDDTLSPEEAPARLRQSFGRLDLDADGSVSRQELTKALAASGSR